MFRKPILILFLFFCCTSCFYDPEDQILGDWVEVKWEYEDYDIKELKEHDHRRVRRHETEKWTFLNDDTFIIEKANGKRTVGEWRLAGRGHILKLMYDNGDREVYDIKELNDEELIINIDIGMEIKGIAKLHLKRPYAVKKFD